MKELYDDYDKLISNGWWNYDFTNEKCKKSHFHSEASCLSQIIFMKLLSKTGVGDFSSHKNKPKIVLEDNERTIEFSFDVMNNPKLKSNKDRDHYRFGSIAKREDVDCTKWESIYHTIGNFSLLPNYDEARKRHLQLKHNDVNERWDILLNFCRKEWKEFSCSCLNDQFNTFNEYMKYTIQEMYFEDIYKDFLDKLNNRTLSEVDSQVLLEWKEEWDTKIKKEEELPLISFGEKSIELPIREIIDKICILIELRGRMILAYLND